MKASVIIPAYNAEKTIFSCLSSIRKQAGDFEIIVVDDGSTDGTVSQAKKIEEVKVLSQANRGPASARNLGAKTAAGEILVFTDADCIVDESWLSGMIAPFSDKDVIGVQGSYRTNQRELIARFAQIEIEDRYERMESSKSIDFIGTYSAAYRRDIFLKKGGFDEDFPKASGEDPEFSFKLSKDGHKMVFTRKAVVYHRHPDSLGKYLKQKFWRAYWRNLLYKKHPGKMKSESYTPQTLKAQIFLFYAFSLSLLLYAVFMISMYIPILLIVILFTTTLPFSIHSFRKDKPVGIFSPIILLLRTVVFSIGLVWGFARARG